MIDVTKMTTEELTELTEAIKQENERREDISVTVSRINNLLSTLFNLARKDELIDLVSNQTGEILAAMQDYRIPAHNANGVCFAPYILYRFTKGE